MKRFFLLLILITAFLTCTAAESPLSDYIKSAFESGIISGNENGDFKPDKPASRAEFAVMLTRFLDLKGGINYFADVSDTDWFRDAVVAARHHGLLLGDTDGRALPLDYITLEDAVTVIGRYYRGESENRSGTEGVSEYAKSYYAYALENNLFSGCLNINPKEPAKKGDILALLYNFDRQSTARVRFMRGYPKLSEDCEFGSISVEMRTNKPCTVYYGLAKAGNPYYVADIKLCDITALNKTVIANIPANINERYDVYLKLVNTDEIPARVSVIKDVLPFSVASGDGTAESPYIIYSGRQLLDITLSPSGHYRLGDNIYLGDDFQSIGEFSGVFDGNGFKISGMVIDDDGEDLGLFKVIKGGEVKNLAVDAQVSAKKNVGIIAGRNEGGMVSGCTVTGVVEARTNNAGGICGTNNGTIENCLSAVYSVKSGSFAGGIAGQNYRSIKKCIAASETVASDMYAGGIAGANDNGRIENSVSACMTVYDTMTLNSGRLTTNKKDGICENNYCYADVYSNAAYEESGRFSQNGYDAEWEELVGFDFYEGLGFSRSEWTAPKNGYRLICPKYAPLPELEKGRTAYMPKNIACAEELRAIDKNESGHYILAGDITLNLPWKTICAQDGFSGTFDGNGYTIYNLNLKSDTGMFSNITGGTVRNLTLRNAAASPGSGGAILTACNYGYIQNCSVYGRIDTKKAGFLGVIAGENYGEISDCRVWSDINSSFDNATVGGICAENSGIIIRTSYGGKIYSSGANTVVGGICGYNTGGYIFESFANSEIKAKNKTAYIGGICGITSGGQVYKCASAGRIVAEGEKNMYAGGSCGLSENSAVYNCLSVSDIHISGKEGYVGGINGCNSGSNLQNTYSSGNVIAVGDISVGGICGYTENGFVMQNVALNPAIGGSGKIGAVAGTSVMSEVSDNYSCDKTLINSKYVKTSTENGTVKSLQSLKGTDFYFKSIASGGLLGWETGDSNVWTQIRGYAFPVLADTPGQDMLTMPVYK